MTKPENHVTTNTQWARMIACAAADACGVAHEQLFDEAGVALSSWQSLNRITQADITALWKAADRLAGRPDIGLWVLDHFHFQTLGPVAYKMMAAETFRQSIQDIFHHIPLVSETWHFSLEERGALGMVKFRLANPDVGITHHSYDSFISACTRLLRDCFPNELFRFSEVWLAHPDFGLRESYENRLGCQCRFNTAEYAMCFDAALLDTSLPSADPELYETLDSRLEQQAKSGQGMTAEIEKAILDLIKRGISPSRQQVSSKLGLGERTMLRRLKEESRTYKDIQEGVLERLARQWLQRGDSMESIAEQLSYADAASLGKMLKRRTGIGIRELRKS